MLFQWTINTRNVLSAQNSYYRSYCMMSHKKSTRGRKWKCGKLSLFQNMCHWRKNAQGLEKSYELPSGAIWIYLLAPLSDSSRRYREGFCGRKKLFSLPNLKRDFHPSEAPFPRPKTPLGSIIRYHSGTSAPPPQKNFGSGEYREKVQSMICASR